MHDLEFASNPCGLRHTCIPTKWTNEISQRTFYEKYQEWRGDPKYATHDPYKEYGNFLYETERSERLAERDKKATLANFSDYERCRVTIRRNLRQHLESAATMEHIPDYLATNADGSRFSQSQTDDIHIYLSEKVIRKACQNGLDTLVADGILSMHPNQREKNGQLYTIHGVCNGKVTVPLVFALTNRKTEEVYETIFSMLRDVMEEVMERQP